jgi:hypothetical protein
VLVSAQLYSFWYRKVRIFTFVFTLCISWNKTASVV